MNVNPSDLLPPQPNQTYESKLSHFKLFKNGLTCFVVLGGLFLIVDTITESPTSKIETVKKSECDDIDDQLSHKKFAETMLYIERDVPNEKVLDLMKRDVATLQNQVMNIWNNMNGLSPTCNLPDMENRIRNAILENDIVDRKIKKALDTYDADKLALYDYAANYAGGEVVATPDTTPYPTSKIMQLFSFFKLTYSSSPNEIIRPNNMPGDCFRFYGSNGRIILKLGKRISIGSVTMEHSPLVEDFSDAPKDFKVYGLTHQESNKKTLLGTYTFNVRKGEAFIKNFPISSSVFSISQFDVVELEILNNQGNPKFTSIYRFRVHAGKSQE